MATVPQEQEYDVFLSCPLGSMADRQSQEVWSNAKVLLGCLENDCGLRVFFMGRDARSKDALEDSDLPRSRLERAVQALRGGRHFLLFYPAKLASGVLTEAGMALAEGKPCLFVVRNRAHLPFILRHAEAAFPARIHEYKTIEGLLGLFKSRHHELFGKRPPADAPAPASPGPPQTALAPADPRDAGPASREKLDRLRRTMAELSEDLRSLDHLLLVDIPSSLNKTRFIAEKILHKLCLHNGITWGAAEPTLERMLGPLVAAGCIPKNVSIHVRTIQMNSSPGSHYQEFALSSSHAAIAQQALIEFLDWYSALPLVSLTKPPPGGPG